MGISATPPTGGNQYLKPEVQSPTPPVGVEQAKQADVAPGEVKEVTQPAGNQSEEAGKFEPTVDNATTVKELPLSAEDAIKEAQLDKAVDTLKEYHEDEHGEYGTLHDPDSELKELKNALESLGFDPKHLDGLMAQPGSEGILKGFIDKLNDSEKNPQDVYKDMLQLLVGGPGEQGMIEKYKKSGGSC